MATCHAGRQDPFFFAAPQKHFSSPLACIARPSARSPVRQALLFIVRFATGAAAV